MGFNVAVLQLNFIVGDLNGNTKKILDGYRIAVAKGADLVVTTELSLFGYPPKDLLQLPDKLEMQESCLSHLAHHIDDVPLIVGVAEGNGLRGMPLFNSAIVISNDAEIGKHRKMLLPNYDVFDERRYFEPGTGAPKSIRIGDLNMGLLICEDIWGGTEAEGRSLYDTDPIAFFDKNRPDVLIVVNASPYYWGKGSERFELVSRIAQRLTCSVVYANQVGGNDEIVFDGRSFIVDAEGNCIAAGKAFDEDVLIGDVTSQGTAVYPFDAGNLAELNNALVLGVRDYLEKIGASKVVIGLSGGVDSAVTACLAVQAIGKEHVLGVLMPSDISSKDSVTDARELAENLGIDYKIVPIGAMYSALGRSLSDSCDFAWYDPDDDRFDVTQENVQARLRGIILMAFSNRENRIVLSTGNKSEVAVGFCTLYGDMCGGLAVLSDVWKTVVWDLANHLRETWGWIPQNTITKPPSADLRPGQVDTDALPPYHILDEIIHLFVEEQRPVEYIAEAVGDEEMVLRVITMIRNNEFKRQQMPPGLKVTSKAFGIGRRFPIASR